MESKTLTYSHIGGELLILGGMAFYFHKKTASLQEEINKLKADQDKLKGDLEFLASRMYGIVNQGKFPRPQPVQQPIQPPPPQPSLLQPRQKRLAKLAKPAPAKSQKEEESSDESGAETLEDQELDGELNSEYEKLKPGDKCSGDTCKLID